ncbi:MAG: CBS domain-containing protein [Alphaproteobacteria bacterium]|nr:CBS domain-containing protein [Alphaproteobacteria bacterium]
MTRDVVSVSDTAELGDITTLLETKTTKRVPVDRDSKVIGIVSRANLVRALAAAGIRLTSDTAVDDRTIRERLVAELKAQEWVHTWGADVIVREGAVHLWGLRRPPCRRKNSSARGRREHPECSQRRGARRACADAFTNLLKRVRSNPARPLCSSREPRPCPAASGEHALSVRPSGRARARRRRRGPKAG